MKATSESKVGLLPLQKRKEADVLAVRLDATTTEYKIEIVSDNKNSRDQDKGSQASSRVESKEPLMKAQNPGFFLRLPRQQQLYQHRRSYGGTRTSSNVWLIRTFILSTFLYNS